MTFYRREVIIRDGDRAEFETSEPVAMVQSALVPRLDTDDLIYVDGRLYHVRTALDDGSAQIKCVLVAPQWEKVLRAGASREVAFVGKPRNAGVAIVREGDTWNAGDSFDAGDTWDVVGVDSWVTGYRRIRFTRV